MSDWNEERALHKAKKIGQVDAKVVAGKGKKKPRPWKVMARWFFRGLMTSPKEYIAHRSASKEEAEAWIEKQKRSWYMRRQDQSARATEEARKRAEEDAKRYWIVGPKETEAA